MAEDRLKPSKRAAPSSPGRPRNPVQPSAFVELLQNVPLEERQRMAAAVIGRDIQDYDDLIKLNQFLLAEMLGGNIPVELAREARGFAEQIFTNIAAKGSYSAANNVADSLRALADAQKTIGGREIVASYTVEEAPQPILDVIPIDRAAQ